MKLLYDTQTKKLLPWPRIDEEPVVGLAPHLLEMTVVQQEKPAYDPATQQLEKTEVIDTDGRAVTRGWSVVEVPAPTFTAEQHLESNGYGPLRLVALLDLEAKLAAAQKTSAAMSAARGWIDGILAAYASDPSPRGDWPVPPVAFEVAVAEAVAVLQP